MRAKSLLAVLPACLLLAGCDFDDIGDSTRYHEDFHYNYPLKAGGRIEVESFNGSIEISAWDQDTVDISGTRYARSQDSISNIKIDVDHTPDALSIHTTKPSVVGYGNYGARFVIKAPRKAVVERVISSNGGIRLTDLAGPTRIRTSNAGVHINGLEGEVTVETSNATVELNDITGSVTAHTSNGPVRGKGIRGALDVSSSNGGIDLAFAPGPARSIRAHTSNSGITLRMAGEVNARLSASTSNGSIQSDFETLTRGDISRNHIEGVIGGGGPLIDLHSSNGTIRLIR